MVVYALLSLTACGTATLLDRDGDGVSTFSDCDDEDDEVFPGAVETCDGEDEDCDGDADEGAVDGYPVYPDADGDGWGAEGDPVISCSLVLGGYVNVAGDCDDTRATVNLDATETCATEDDDDCDGLTDEVDAIGCAAFYADADADGTPGWDSTCRCEAGVAWIAGPPSDCDDADPSISAGCGLNGETRLDDGTLRVTGGPRDRELGARVAVADVDGDGAADLLLGTTGGSPHLSVLLGPMTGDSDAAAADLQIALASNRLIRLVGGDDLTDDGQPDLVVALEGTASTAAQAWLVDGGWRGAVAVDQVGAELTFQPDDSVALATGDVTGDGLADLAVALPSPAVVLYPGPVGTSERLDGPTGASDLGFAALAGVDLDGDGVGDLALSASLSDTTALWTWAGPLTAGPTALDATARVTHPGGAGPADELVDAGDVDGDGLPDLALAEEYVWVLPGTVTGPLDGDDVALGIVRDVPSSLEMPLAALGDTDGDGLADLAIGARAYSEVNSNAGAVGIWRGGAGGSLLFSDLLILRAPTPGEYAGADLAAGDLDGDGAIDLLVGAPGMDLGGGAAGGAYIVRGAP